ncbi:MAG: NAD-dependent epimerase/dehydratase family protein [Anaerolineae bacterium]
MSRSGLSVLVTGANGFVGSHFTEALLARGHHVRCMVRSSSDLTYIRHLPVEWEYGDVCDADCLHQACQGIDVICHCAALTRAVDEETFLRVNTEGTRALARAAIEAAPNMQRFLFVSSQTAAGPSRGADDFVDESRPPQPITWYGRSKWEAEQALLSMSGELPLTIVRSVAVFGPRDRDFFTYFDLVNRHLQLKLGRNERKVTLIYIRDLIDLILLALENEVAVGQTYFGCGQVLTYDGFSETISRALGKRAVRITLPVAVTTPIAMVAGLQERLTGRPALLNGQRIKDMRQPYWLCSGDKARVELGFETLTDLDTAVRETVDWYRENGWL